MSFKGRGDVCIRVGVAVDVVCGVVVGGGGGDVVGYCVYFGHCVGFRRMFELVLSLLLVLVMLLLVLVSLVSELVLVILVWELVLLLVMFLLAFVLVVL